MKRVLLAAALAVAVSPLALAGGAVAQTPSACWTNGVPHTCSAAENSAMQSQASGAAAVNAVVTLANAVPTPSPQEKLIVGKTYTVAQLPPCAANVEGWTLNVSDATSPTWHTALTGLGAVHVGAVCRGGSWLAQ